MQPYLHATAAGRCKGEKLMKLGKWTGFVVCGALTAAMLAQSGPARSDEPAIVMPDQIAWLAVGNAGMQTAVIHGNPKAEGPYTMLIKVPAEMKIPPHTHADAWRTSVVISGTFHFAFGDVWDEAALQPFTPGTIWTEPSGANHFGWARDGEVVAMLTAMGPTGTTPVAPAQ